MTLFTKCIFKETGKNDGLRISVMSRHTLNDGATLDRRITSCSFDRHYPELAPSPKLIGDYYKRGLSWNEFESRFREQMQNSSVQNILMEIAEMSVFGNVTLMCSEDEPHLCHRRLLAEECKKLLPEITIDLH